MCISQQRHYPGKGSANITNCPTLLLLKPFGIKSTSVSFRSKRQLKSLSVPELKMNFNEQTAGKYFSSYRHVTYYQDVWTFNGNVENNCSNPPLQCNLQWHRWEWTPAFLCCLKGVVNSQGCFQRKHYQISCS